MEPVTAALLAASLVVAPPSTSRIPWETAKKQSRAISSADPFEPLLRLDPAASEKTIIETPLVVAGPRHSIAVELRSYEKLQTGWDCPESKEINKSSISSALTFLDQIPGGFPLPRPMASQSGEAGLYWDLEYAYVDVHFEEYDILSIYI